MRVHLGSVSLMKRRRVVHAKGGEFVIGYYIDNTLDESSWCPWVFRRHKRNVRQTVHRNVR